MLENKQLKAIGFKKVKGAKKEYFLQIHSEVVLLIQGDTLYVLSNISAAMYLVDGHKTLKKEKYDQWLSEQPDKFIGNYTTQMLQHMIKVMKDSFTEAG